MSSSLYVVRINEIDNVEQDVEVAATYHDELDRMIRKFRCTDQRPKISGNSAERNVAFVERCKGRDQ